MKKGILVDLFNVDTNMIVPLLDDVRNIERRNAHVVVMRSTDDVTSSAIYGQLKTEMMKCGVWAHCIPRDSKLFAFYDAKILFDHYQIKNVSFYCLGQSLDYWRKLTQILLTSAHTWDFKFTGVESGILRYDNSLEKEVDTFLRSLSPFGRIEVLKSQLISAHQFIHGFTGRNGGISNVRGMRSLNLTFSDIKPDALVIIKENRRRLAEAVGFDADNLHIAKTCHGNSVHVVGDDIPRDGFDAVVTNKPGVVVGAPAADCLTFIFADPVRMVCAAAHAGWKGTLLGIVGKTIQTMVERYGSEPKDILVAVGPSIHSCCFDYDLDEEDIAAFKGISPECVIWKGRHPKPFLDLQKANNVLLRRANIQQDNIDERNSRQCSSCKPESFFSFQRDGVPFGNQIGFIGIANTD